MDDRRTWLLMGTIALVAALLLAGFFWYLGSTTTSGGESSEGMGQMTRDPFEVKVW